jgi:hypothetical protein
VFPTNNVEKCGNIISKGSTREEAVNNAEKSVRKVFIRLKPDNPNTNLFLFKNDNKFYNSISAFELKYNENIKVLADMLPESYTNNSTELTLINLPELSSETSRDWHGTVLPDAFNRVLEITGIKTDIKNGKYNKADKNKLLLGKLFWNVFLKGSIQAGVYIIDTIRERIFKKLNPFEF